MDEIETIIKDGMGRIESSIKFEWTGGFEPKFFEDWLRTTLLNYKQVVEGNARAQGYRDGYNEASKLCEALTHHK